MRFGRRGFLGGLAASSLAGRSHAANRPTALDALRSKLKGRLIVPGDEAYDGARRGASFGPTEDRRPLLIVQCAAEDDVARAIAFGRSALLPIAVKSGGHDVLGECTTDGGVVIDLSSLKRIEIDAANATARVQAGVRSGEFALAAKAHGLAPVLGCNPAVGVAGLTLGGGLGWLLGTLGAACDNLIGADVLTADGRRLHVSEREHPDLFWGLRGGGGNFGVVTSLEYRLHPVTTVLAGAVGFRGDVGAFLRLYREVMTAAPDGLAVELSISAGAPPGIVAICCWRGNPDEGREALARLLAFGATTFDTLRPVAFGDFAGGGPAAPQGNLFWRGGSLDGLSDEAIGRLGELAQGGRPGLSIGLGHHMHGQVCAVADSATPLVRRRGQLSYFIGSGWRTPAQADAAIGSVTAAMESLRPLSTPAAYINSLSSDAEADVRGAYGEANYARLQRLKDRYDPTNLFHLNRNIRPSSGLSRR
jgi:FAD/FMN-containing dehydrogenase